MVTKSMPDKIVRIGGASGFTGDSTVSVPQLLTMPGLNYIVFDYLAEPALGRLAKQGRADENSGYWQDFVVTHMAPHLKAIMAQGVKIISNAGGFNPRACAEAIAAAATKLGLSPRIAYVEGDNLLDRAGEFRARGVRDMFSGAPFPDKAGSINAYLGGFPIAAALDRGADIVVTGRVVDSAVTLGALIHEFGWREQDFDLLAAGTLAGHLLECGPQSTGGTFTDWRDVPDWTNIGYPVAECRADGAMVITKPPDTGGLVSVGTVAEQILYEISDPQAYFVPDVTCDFSAVHLEQAGADRVAVSHVIGRAPTDTYKVCMTYEQDWRTTVLHPIIGLEAVAKAERQSQALIARTRRMLGERGLGDWQSTHLEVLGGEASYGPHGRARQAREVVARISVEHASREACAIFEREHRAASVSMSVGKAKDIGSTIEQVGRLFSFLLEKSALHVSVTMDGKTGAQSQPTEGGFHDGMITRPAVPAAWSASGQCTNVPLIRLAWARSGDKGNLFNLGVIARKPEWLPMIVAALSTEAVAHWFAHVFAPGSAQRVDRYFLPGFAAINFVLHESLDGGGLASRRIDPNAKGMAQQLLEFPVPVPAALAAELQKDAVNLDAAPYNGPL